MKIPCAICGDSIEPNPGFEIVQNSSENHGYTLAPWWHVILGNQEDDSDHEAIPDPEFIMALTRHPSTSEPEIVDQTCKRCLFKALPGNDFCMGHLAVMQGHRKIGVTTNAVKEPHLRGVEVAFIGFWRGNPTDIIAEQVSTLDTDEPSILNLGTFEVEWKRSEGGVDKSTSG